MNWSVFNTYGLGHRDAFETLNNQLFERFINRTYIGGIKRFKVVNGTGGDGGVEAFAELQNGNIIGLQSKWFLNALDKNELDQIYNSIGTAKKIRSALKEYIICIPHDVSSVRIGKGNKPTQNAEDNRINALVDKVGADFPGLLLTWWFDHELLSELEKDGNEGIHKFWFEREVISGDHLKRLFNLKKQQAWLKDRYVPDLNSLGKINSEYQKLIFSSSFRQELIDQIKECVNKLERGLELIELFLTTDEIPDTIKGSLSAIVANLKLFIEEFDILKSAATSGSRHFRLNKIEEVDIWTGRLDIDGLSPTHVQKPIIKKLVKILEEIHQIYLPDYLLKLARELNLSSTLFSGRAGTGKTHGLAFCTEMHLNNGMPAIIIQAKGSPSNSWTSILSGSLDLHGWNTDELLSAFESMAIRNDNVIASNNGSAQNPLSEASVGIICVDGIEEAIGHESEWNDRIAESVEYTKRFPRVRFLFTARDYFEYSRIEDGRFSNISLPYEGDVPIMEVAGDYLKHYHIKVADLSKIAGLDSLLALKLFCEHYKGVDLETEAEIVTATGKLLSMKVDRVEKEYLSTLDKKKGSRQRPVREALIEMSKCFYTNSEIEHIELRNLILRKVQPVLDANEVDLMIDHFAKNGILSDYSVEKNDSVLVQTETVYNITYQSIIEHLLSEQIYADIKNNKLTAIPNILHSSMHHSIGTLQSEKVYDVPANQKIIQFIVDRLFVETGKLIGDDGFLTEGLKDDLVLELRLTALENASNELAINYKDYVESLFLGRPFSQWMVLKYLIVPSCHLSGKCFGSTFLHSILSKFPNAFERDRKWSGNDSYDDNSEEAKQFSNNIKSLLDAFDMGLTVLLKFEKFDEKPLLFSWALSNVDQVLRNSVRKSLAGWAIKNPLEFVKLLDTVFFCNDPQIQEDLASVALGIATYLNDPEGIAAISDWAVNNVFSQKANFRNVIIRQGFRAIIEKAGMLAVCSAEQVELARPSQMITVELIGLDEVVLAKGGEEMYPIKKDLAWYVIKDAYENFLELPTSSGKGPVRDRDCLEAKALLDQYRSKYSKPDLFGHEWAIASAIHYIKNTLGLTRENGNSWTGESHGSKSKVYTLEEKYTWIAVHYLQGYLSDYVPAGDLHKPREWIKDYATITEIPNPGEAFDAFDFLKNRQVKSDEWIIKVNLAPTLELTGDVDAKIRSWVNEQPKIDFAKWVQISFKDFPEFGEERNWAVLSNDTALHESSDAGRAAIHICSVIIKERDLENLKFFLQQPSIRGDFFRDLDGLKSSPDTSIYSNPADLMWMKWIRENYTETSFFRDGKEIVLQHTLVKVVQETVNGEKHYDLPSKMVREWMNITSFSDSIMKDAEGNIQSFIHKKDDGSFRDSQQIVVIDIDRLDTALNIKGLKLIWFCDFIKKKNPLNEVLKENVYDQRTWKYLIWEDQKEIKQLEFWSGYFSDTMDSEIDTE
jgi:hypothetical protein